MDQTLPTLPTFDVDSIRSLLTEFNTLTAFADVESWDTRAAQHINQIKDYVQQLASAEAHMSGVEDQAKQAHASKSLFRRAFTSSPEAKAAKMWMQQATALKQALTELLDQLEGSIEKTPNSAEEQREMLRDLKMVKKELTLQKREANEAMRQIRANARQRSAKIGTGLGAMFSTPSTRRWSRIGVRLEKEAKVAPHERSRSDIERRILVIDRTIHWVERFR
jgi:chromosome segregation ATPase